jgi:NitT/TauT family transport system substrate-binding protein
MSKIGRFFKGLTIGGRFLLAAIIVGALVLVGTQTSIFKYIVPTKNKTVGTFERDSVIKIAVVTWGGYAGGEYYNDGFSASKDSRFYTEKGILVEFVLMDDFDACRAAWKADEVDLMWGTIDAFTTEVKGLEEYEPKVILQADWSFGGDACVVTKDIKSVNDLKGKKVSFAEMQPSQTYLLWMLEAAGMTYDDIIPVPCGSAPESAEMFKKGQVDCAIVWSPDDEACIDKATGVTGAKILNSTKDASRIIADVFIAKGDYVDSNKERLQKLVEGWLIGAAEINTDTTAKREAAKILSEGLGQPEDFCFKAINNVRLCTWGDNKIFYGIDRPSGCVTGEDIYNKMALKFAKIGYETSDIQNWREIAYSGFISGLKFTDKNQLAEGEVEFDATKEVTTTISTKEVSITFATNSYTLDENAKYIIDNEFLDVAKSFKNAKIRISGNTDNIGDATFNKTLSYKRANAVVDYLIAEHGFAKTRFIVVGNGSDNPIAVNTTEDGRAKNRRTDFEIVK